MIDLRQGDCLGPVGLASLGDGAVDVAISDPPFDRRCHRAALEVARPGRGRKVCAELPFAALDAEQLDRVAAELARVTRRWIVVFSAERHVEAWAAALERAGARFVRLGWANRTNARPQLSGDRPAPAADPLVIAHGRYVPLRWNGGGRSARWDAPAARFDEGGQVHPTQKPLTLMRALLEDFSDRGELVLDPFAGAGSTAVACKELGRRFLGWEMDPGYHAAAMRRIERTREQLSLAVGPLGEQLEIGGLTGIRSVPTATRSTG
jgi:site-specific DNA-methyltransferase (adenine-specific)